MASLLLLSVLFVGCMEQDKSEVSKENFAELLNKHYKQDKNCILLEEFTRYPKSIYSGSEPSDEEKRFRVYEKLGLLTMVPGKTHNNKTEYTVDLTEKGKKDYNDIDGTTTRAGSRGFCAGYYGVEEITNYTKPADMFGQTISRVKFTTKAKELKPWAKELVDNELFKKKFAPQDEKAVLLLTEVKGWIHEKDFKNK